MASAKGLEADLVFVVGLEQNSFPYYSAEGEELEEQYRLLYVSMTRAKEELHLYHALVRRGSISFRKRPPGSEHGKPTPAEVLTWLPPGTTEWREHWPRRATKRQRRKVL